MIGERGQGQTESGVMYRLKEGVGSQEAMVVVSERTVDGRLHWVPIPLSEWREITGNLVDGAD